MSVERSTKSKQIVKMKPNSRSSIASFASRGPEKATSIMQLKSSRPKDNPALEPEAVKVGRRISKCKASSGMIVVFVDHHIIRYEAMKRANQLISVSNLRAQLIPILLSLFVSSCIAISASQEAALIASNQTRDVTNLHLIPDHRAVTLRWTFEHNDTNIEPVYFDLRFCELTSWNIEIKCRHRELPVSQTNGSSHVINELTTLNAAAERSVERRLDEKSNRWTSYEARISDLRAYTNYTFQVLASRFSNEPQSTLIVADRRQRSRASQLASEELGQPISSRVETKPFGAEATKCLADATEVLVTTGRHFAGRISVEDSNNPRCQITGNKSSLETSYLFRIDHELCGSKIVDGERIETMLLVHENKDILTHDTARFLVVCNFLRKSFTLRASVSLPKVNSMAPNVGRRPALIVSLAGRPTGQIETQPQSVSLGSMPGVYRARNWSVANEDPDLQLMNTISHDERADQQMAASHMTRQPKELVGGSHQSAGQRLLSGARSLMLAPELTSVPAPVQVRGKALYVDKGEPTNLLARGERLYDRPTPIQAWSTPGVSESDGQQLSTPQMTPWPTTQALGDGLGSHRRQDQDGAGSQWPPLGSIQPLDSDHSLNSHGALINNASWPLEQQTSNHLALAPVIITNNHRVAGDHLAINPANRAAKSVASEAEAPVELADSAGNFSIRYSSAKVDEFAMGRQQDDGSQTRDSSSSMELEVPRARSGRMRAMGASSKQQATNRMGESSISLASDNGTANGDELATWQHPVTWNQEPNGTLAQNITGVLLRWSLKQLTNLAKKSIESLINEPTNATEASLQAESLHPRDEHLLRPTPFHALATEQSPRVPETERPFPAQGLVPSLPFAHRPSQNFQFNQKPHHQAQGRSGPATTRIPAKASASEPPPSGSPAMATTRADNIIVLDGFHTGNRRPPPNPQLEPSEAPRQQVASRQTATRPSNYSKSIDFGRSDARLSTTTVGPTSLVTASRSAHAKAPGSQLGEPRPPLDPQPVSDSLWSNRESFYSSWLFYGLVLFVALVMGALVSLCLATMLPIGRATRLSVNCRPDVGSQAGGGHQRFVLAGSSVNRSHLALVGEDPESDADSLVRCPNGPLVHDAATSYRRYDYNRPEASYPHKLTAGKTSQGVARPANATARCFIQVTSGQPSVQGSGYVRSSLADDSSSSSSPELTNSPLGEESDCKQNEILYTAERVLVSSRGSSCGESYA